MLRRVWAPLVFVVSLGCGDSGEGAEGTPETSESGGSEGSGSSAESGTSGESGGESESDPLEGELFGLLTATRYRADAAGFPEYVDLAAGLRDAPFEALEDFVSVVHLQTTFAPPSGALDEVVVGPKSTPWSFDPASSWLRGGDGIRLRALDPDGGSVEMNGCRRSIGNFAEFPVYLTGSEDVPEDCRADAQGYIGATPYELVVFGGGLFDDEIAPEQLPSPEAFSVSAPDISIYDLQLSRSEALELTWTSPTQDEQYELEETEYRFVVRLWDESGTIATVVAADDGALSIPADALMNFEVGPATITFARETLSRASLSVGSVDVILREEHWGYLELY